MLSAELVLHGEERLNDIDASDKASWQQIQRGCCEGSSAHASAKHQHASGHTNERKGAEKGYIKHCLPGNIVLGLRFL